MKKTSHKHDTMRTLELKKEVIVRLIDDQLKHVAGGVNSTRPSQCVTLCF